MRKLLHAIIISIFLLACNKGNEDPNSLNEQDKVFLRQVYISNKIEIEAGQLALNTSNNTMVRNFARDVVNYYNRAQMDLKEVFNKVAFQLDSNLIPAQGLLFSDLSGYTFDTSYMKSRVITHRNLLSVFQNELNEGNHTYVRYYYLNKYLDGIRSYSLQADSIARAL